MRLTNFFRKWLPESPRELRSRHPRPRGPRRRRLLGPNPAGAQMENNDSKQPVAATRELLSALLRSNLASFIQMVFQTLNPGTAYLGNWHIQAIAWHLQQVLDGRILRLVITMPPRSLKSISASVAFPAFVSRPRSRQGNHFGHIRAGTVDQAPKRLSTGSVI
ncbi:hypothetical protein MES5069_360179 [Mesorhizobium escarrei]|uniref:Uncharacterized protein n=1 Tax=Mesorhizobium escarrei TaxID=666018 RepID=A0ABN8K1B9_9HYPH|nr:hypothetical protein MES5069_360179 [Mesorhizobium escarrei]